MEQNNKKIFIIAAILAIFTSALVYVFLSRSQPTVQNVQYVNAIVAAKDIDPRTVITDGDLKEIKIEKSQLNKNALLSKSDIINKTSKDAIYEDEQILKTRLADNYSELSFRIPNGKRAITINVNEGSAVGYFVKPGDYVDIIATLQRDTEGGKEYPRTTKTLLQNILVLGVGQNKENSQTALANATQAQSSKSSTNTAKTATLAVAPEDAEKIALSEEAGMLRLTLRPVGDKSEISSTGIIRSSLTQ